MTLFFDAGDSYDSRNHYKANTTNGTGWQSLQSALTAPYQTVYDEVSLARGLERPSDLVILYQGPELTYEQFKQLRPELFI